jgi:ABC-2 type transport system permease protein
MNAAGLTLFQMRYVNKAFWRNPAAAFFTFVFPLMFLVIFTALLGDYRIRVGGREIHQSTYYVAEMAAYALISACYNNIAIGLTFQRDAGVLKRVNGTPLPAAAYLVARVLHAMVISLILVALTVAFGRVAYDASVPSGATLVRFLIVLMVGASAFCALGFAVTALIPNADAAAPIVNATILPLLFLSGVFIPIGDNAPAWVSWTARMFPVKHFADGMQASFLGNAFRWVDVLVVAAWGVLGVVVALRFFTWEPRRS